MASIAPAPHTRGPTSTDVWITPKWLIDRLGPFDLDPCANVPQPWPCAAREYTVEDDGLVRPWSGLVWCNPPYGRRLGAWLAAMAEHGNGIALIFARTETEAFRRFVWPAAELLLFIDGRLTFCRPDGSRARHNSGGPSVLLAYGETAAGRLSNHWDLGALCKPVRTGE